MENPLSTKSKNKILKFLPKAAQAAVSFQNPPFSPGKDKLKPRFSVSMIPAEARRRSKNSNFETQEPTSPKVSCMGQIKHKKKLSKKHLSLPKGFKPALAPPPAPQLKKNPSRIRNIFKPAAGRKSDASVDYNKPPLPDRAPCLSQMKRFASTRDTLANFDWTKTQIAPEQGEFDSDEEGIIPFSAPIMVAGGGSMVALEPRKEINLWKRRTMVQPKPLKLNVN
ncbi:uncharacterized protein At1g76070-like [Olea europaea var. sylvestris]|uniref:Uncharacterized protein n=1 Tax=Olea europaea subsp. europaea TaxID=158383 RepID=A0A8S0V299_OLEEU|nr:uncharacterized protein At1g76070-like [Olea europaea var. sylvestris]CAA3025105.1 Hypothetical predicted protein [Olea europaea subsp. europaea]